LSEQLGITFEEHDRAGVVTLDRPTRLNALTCEMFEALSANYRRWEPAAQIYGVVMESTHPKVFCSGGDLKVLNQLNHDGAVDEIREFYRSAYTHVWVLEKFIRPNVPLINGLAFGGGIGISLLGTHCIAGEGYRFAMPQVGIGFLPDIGGTYFLPRLYGWVGTYLALTGAEIGPADAHRLRLVSHYIPSAYFGTIKTALADNHPIDRLLDGLHQDPGEGELVRLTPAINRIFSAPTVEEILERLDSEPEGPYEAWAKETAKTLRQKSPTSLKIALQQMLRGKSLELDEALKLEFRLASHLVTMPDFKEGIDAKIAGKGRAPNWTPETVADVDDSRIESLFETAVDGELELNEPKQVF
jgi:enoyl-CoA hydratase